MTTNLPEGNKDPLVLPLCHGYSATEIAKSENLEGTNKSTEGVHCPLCNYAHQSLDDIAITYVIDPVATLNKVMPAVNCIDCRQVVETPLHCSVQARSPPFIF